MDHIARIAHIEVIDDESAAVLRKIPGSKRLAMVDELIAFGRNLMRSRMRELHPDWDEGKIAREVARRIADAAH